MNLCRTATRNRLLRAMIPADHDLLKPHLEPCSLARGAVLAESDETIRSVVFLESGVASMVVTSANGVEVEAGLMGWDGVAPVATLLNVPRASDRVIMQLPGDGLRIPTPQLLQAMEISSSLRRLMARYVHCLHVQVRQTVLACAVQTIEGRLARWVLMCSDRQEGDDIPLTHEFLAVMLGVRRPSVTEALHALEGEGLIRSRRGSITVLARRGLELRAGDSYGRAEEVYRELIGVDARTGAEACAERRAG